MRDFKLVMVVHVCNPILGKFRQEDCKFKASLGYTARTCLKQTNKQKKQTKKNSDSKDAVFHPLFFLLNSGLCLLTSISNT
jgi:hypothetical protein